jgi:Dehydrogenase E1 component
MSTKVHLDHAHRHHLLRQMIRIRHFEAKCVELYQGQKILGFLHLYDGEEAVSVGVMEALGPEDAGGDGRRGAHSLGREACRARSEASSHAAGHHRQRAVGGGMTTPAKRGTPHPDGTNRKSRSVIYPARMSDTTDSMPSNAGQLKSEPAPISSPPVGIGDFTAARKLERAGWNHGKREGKTIAQGGPLQRGWITTIPGIADALTRSTLSCFRPASSAPARDLP